MAGDSQSQSSVSSLDSGLDHEERHADARESEEGEESSNEAEKMVDQLEMLEKTMETKRLAWQAMTAKVDQNLEQRTDADTEWLLIDEQLREIETLKKEEKLTETQQKKVARSAALEKQKALKNNAITLLNIEKNQLEKGVKAAKDRWEEASKEYDMIQKFCNTCLQSFKTGSKRQLASSSVQQSTPKRPKRPLVPITLNRVFDSLQPPTSSKRSVTDMSVLVEKTGDMMIPTFEQKDKLFRTPDLVMKDIAELIKFPHCIEVRKQDTN